MRTVLASKSIPMLSCKIRLDTHLHKHKRYYVKQSRSVVGFGFWLSLIYYLSMSLLLSFSLLLWTLWTSSSFHFNIVILSKKKMPCSMTQVYIFLYDEALIDNH